jgi:pilus assembly protein CpaE
LMTSNAHGLLITQDTATAAALIDQIAQQQLSVRIQVVRNVQTGLARIAGGGIDVVLKELPADVAETERLESIRALCGDAAAPPVIVLCDTGAERMGSDAVRLGAAAYVARDRWDADLANVVRAAIDQRRRQQEIAHQESSSKSGRMIAVMGSKGGVGTTTVAINLACSLSQTAPVVLLELQPGFGALTSYFGLHRRIKTIAHLLPGEQRINRERLEDCLWRPPNLERLQILFGPNEASDDVQMEAGQACRLVRAVAGYSAYVVVDLPFFRSDISRQISQLADYTALVVNQDAVCIQTAKSMLRTLSDRGAPVERFKAVLVNRAALASPMPPKTIEAELGIPLAAVVPPDPDGCAAAAQARTPLVQFAPANLAAQSLIALAREVTKPGLRQALSYSTNP